MTLRFTSTSNIKFWCISNVPRSVFVNEANCNFMTFVMWRPWHLALGDFPLFLYTKVCLKKHSCNLHAPLCGIFRPNSVVVARYGAFIRAKSPTNCDVHLAESLFQIGSRHGLSHSFVPERKSCTTENQKRSSHKAECSPKWLTGRMEFNLDFMCPFL